MIAISAALGCRSLPRSASTPGLSVDERGILAALLLVESRFPASLNRPILVLNPTDDSVPADEETDASLPPVIVAQIAERNSALAALRLANSHKFDIDTVQLPRTVSLYPRADFERLWNFGQGWPEITRQARASDVMMFSISRPAFLSRDRAAVLYEVIPNGGVWLQIFERSRLGWVPSESFLLVVM